MVDRVWNDELVDRLRRLAAKGLACSEIGEIMGMPGRAIRRKCVKEGIPNVKCTAAEAEELARLKEAAEERRRQRKRAARRAAKPAGAEFKPQGISPTSALYRRTYFPPIPEMSKSQARAMLAEAVRNTAAMPVE